MYQLTAWWSIQLLTLPVLSLAIPTLHVSSVGLLNWSCFAVGYGNESIDYR
ncbi:hypothetical protein MC7420_289 [Coleofasciculus chthonoplastes PCC 7420]|uniref:Uncharacterized protein n=1 Tax=Coleofasciculus chthonoplastes PCC 7420 TaxID=118168 RepID=B4VL12_9CYAN|nr:hypothetical protein MC7420_289 [Coleofasciculus chthonoplastes PCC 7420]